MLHDVANVESSAGCSKGYGTLSFEQFMHVLLFDHAAPALPFAELLVSCRILACNGRELPHDALHAVQTLTFLVMRITGGQAVFCGNQ